MRIRRPFSFSQIFPTSIIQLFYKFLKPEEVEASQDLSEYYQQTLSHPSFFESCRLIIDENKKWNEPTLLCGRKASERHFLDVSISM